MENQMEPTKQLIFDIGANVGGFSSLYCQQYSVLAVEANPDLAETLNRDGRFFVECCAVGSTHGDVEFHICPDAQMSSCNRKWLTEMRYSSVGVSKTITVPCVTLDDLIIKYGIPHHIKVDTEGYEFEVLSGLSHKVDSIQFEYIGEEFTSLTHPVIRCLADLGYSKFVIRNLCGDFTPECFLEYEDDTKHLTKDQILQMDGSRLCGGMILAF
jgi:FkbM family methyltransferase